MAKKELALHVARKYAKKAQGGDDFRKSPNIEDRRMEAFTPFNDSLYFPEGPVVKPMESMTPFHMNMYYPNSGEVGFSPMGDALGNKDLDLRAAGFADGGDVDPWPLNDDLKTPNVPPQVPISGAPAGQQAEPHVEPSRLPEKLRNLGKDWKEAVRESDEAAYGFHKQAQENFQTYNPLRWGLGLGQEALGAAMPAMTPINAAFGTAQKTAERTGPGLGQAVDVASWANPDTLMGDVAKAGMFGLPAFKPVKEAFTKEGVGKLDDIAKHMDQALNNSPETNPEIQKNLKQYTNKDLAAIAGSAGLHEGQIDQLKSHMSPLQQKGFDTYYKKHFGEPPKAPSAGPDLKPVDEMHQPSNFGGYVHPDQLTQVGPQMGSNKGGVYQDKNGVKYYMKEGQTPAHVVNENVAAALYDLAGVPTLKYHHDPTGNHIITRMEKLEKNNASQLDDQEMYEAQHDFGVHAWLANHDVVGTGGDNLGVINGKVTPLDLGGALEYRAKGAPKGKIFGNEVGELQSMRGLDPKVHAPDAAAMFGGMSDEHVADSLKKVINIPDEKIRQVVDNFHGDPKLADKLIARKNYLKDWAEKHGGEPPAKGWESAGYGHDPDFGSFDEHGVEHAPQHEPMSEKELEEYFKNAPAGPEGWKDELYSHTPEEYGDLVGLPKGKETPFEQALSKALASKWPDSGGYKDIPSHPKDTQWLDQFEYNKTYNLPKKVFGGIDSGKIIAALSKYHIGDNPNMTAFGLKAKLLAKELGKLDSEKFLKSMSYYNIKPHQIENVLSYFPEKNIDDMKGLMSEHLGQAGYNVPITSQNLPHAQKKKMREDAIKASLEPKSWKSYAPPEGHTEGKEWINKIDWGKNKPAELEKKGWATKHYVWKGGEFENPVPGGGYPHEIIDPSQKVWERAFFAAPNPEVAAHGYGPLGHPYIAREHKFARVDYGPLAKQLGHQIHPDGGATWSKTLFHDIIEEARKQGYDMIALEGVHDVGSHGLKHTQYAVINPEILRAPRAAFDPKKMHLRHPLAGFAGLPAGAGIYQYLSGGDNDQKYATGGKVKHKHPQIDENPQEHEFINFSKGGLIDSHIPGRTDKIPMRVPPGSYVLPADIPSALGEGNTKAGSEILKKMFTHSAYGLPPPNIHGRAFQYPHQLHFSHVPIPHQKARGGKVEPATVLPANHQLGMKVPKGGSMCANCKYLASSTTCGNQGFVKWHGKPELPEPANEYCCDLYEHGKTEKKADGGKTDHVPIIAAGGEFIIHPDVVKAIGGGDMKQGHKTLDKFVINTRKHHIETLKKLKPPK